MANAPINVKLHSPHPRTCTGDIMGIRKICSSARSSEKAPQGNLCLQCPTLYTPSTSPVRQRGGLYV